MTDADTDFDRHEREMWAGRAAAYQGSFAPLCGAVGDQVLDLARVAGGKRMLDVGTGTGALAVGAAALGALVTAVDAEPSMVEAARLAVPGADVRPAVLPDLPFAAGSFDAVTANFVLNHVGDPAASARELVRVTAPGGHVAASVWPLPQPPLQAFWGEVVADSGVTLPGAPPRLEAARDFPRTPAGLAALLRGAGLEAVRVETVSWTHRFDPEAWWSGPASGLGTLGALMRDLPAESVARIRAAYDRAIADLGDGLQTSALLACGRRPRPVPLARAAQATTRSRPARLAR
ncbi:class I SAM-dependent methyltransferase [Actinoplanes sp. NPDC049668]|uniref:class I SAM-dependent methyltransferase n=1 Tax=unclassified Actinoplanes TaxID=2626549 RepID=UPI0033ACE6F6